MSLMVNAEEIAAEIARLEFEPSSYPNYAKLADLYIIRDHMVSIQSYSTAAYPDEEITVSGQSDFLQAVKGKNTEKVLSIMDDLMTTLAAINERAYTRIMTEIMSI